MTKTTTDYRALVRQASIILFVILALYLTLVRPLAQQGVNVLEGQIEEAVGQLEKYLPEGDELLPTEENLKALRASLARNEQNYQNLQNFIDPKKKYLPPGTQEAGLYFIEQLHITEKRLQRQANTLKIKIPKSFGFSEEMPQASEVEALLKKLEAVDKAATLLMEQGVAEISLLKPLGMVEQRDADNQRLLYRQIPIQLSFLCESSALIKFLYHTKNLSPVLVVKDLIIKRAEGSFLQVEIVLTRLVV